MLLVRDLYQNLDLGYLWNMVVCKDFCLGFFHFDPHISRSGARHLYHSFSSFTRKVYTHFHHDEA